MLDAETLAKLTPTAEEMDAAVEHARKYVDFVLRDGKEAFIPTLIVETRSIRDFKPETAMCVIAADFNEEKDKYPMMEHLGRTFYEQKKFVTVITLASEAWLAKNPEGQPRHDPNRQEGIILMCMASPCLVELCCQQWLPVKRHRVTRAMIPQKWADLVKPDAKNKVSSPLLGAFYRGFFRDAAAKFTADKLKGDRK